MKKKKSVLRVSHSNVWDIKLRKKSRSKTQYTPFNYEDLKKKREKASKKIVTNESQEEHEQDEQNRFRYSKVEVLHYFKHV